MKLKDAAHTPRPTAMESQPANVVMPIFQVIKNVIVDDVRSGRLKPGDRVESENSLARHFHASRMTVNRALRDLTHDGLIRRVRGVGSKESTSAGGNGSVKNPQRQWVVSQVVTQLSGMVDRPQR
ncbi:MAG: GntR family transcriptional regulator [Gammaproteobacteria bacterium]|nr:GntR family transcriptional regulator [Gammaproteobacteria bacterium]